VRKLNLLIVEGNIKSENDSFRAAGIKTHAESCQASIGNYYKNTNIDVVNPSSDHNIDTIISNLKKYDGLIWGGSSQSIYNDTPEIKRQILFMKECFKNIKKIFAICWGMQVAVTAAGGVVKKGEKGSHKGIAYDIEVNDLGLKHKLYKNKEKKFNTPAFNFDEVVKIPDGTKLLASNLVNHVQAINFKEGVSDIWGIQYHPEITYNKMISLIHFRKDRLLDRKAFKDEKEIDEHVQKINDVNQLSDKHARMRELKNWLDYVNEN